MKTLSIMLGLILSAQTFAADTTLLCDDQNSHSVYKLQISSDLATAQVITLMGNSSVLAAGTKTLAIVDEESNIESALYAGKTNEDVAITISLNAAKAVSLKKYEIIEVNVNYASGNTSLLCSRN